MWVSSYGRWWRALLVLLLLVTVLYVLRYPILQGAGSFLISNDPPLRTKAIYVLGGASLDRGLAAKQALDAGLAPVAYCLGANIPPSFLGEGLLITEGQLTANVMLRNGAPPDRVQVIPEGTSTWEEAEAILRHADMHGHDSITVITTDLHSRRVRMVFRKQDRPGVKALIYGAPSSLYDARYWWRSEEGLLMVNNEYVKLGYYVITYRSH